MRKLFPAFFNIIRDNQLIDDHDTIICGYSGGKDSTTLLVLLQELQRHVPFHLIAAYFNHHLRPDAALEADHVRCFCAERGIALECGGRQVREYQAANHLNLEQAASISRYAFFHACAASHSSAKIATAHTRSDLAETFFIKLLRGSGLQGLSAIYQSKEKVIIRPLLPFSSEQIVAFLTRNKIPHYQDASNANIDFVRNRIRHELMPVVGAIEAQAEARILRTVGIIQEDYDYLTAQARAMLQKHLILQRIFPASLLRGQHKSMQRHLVREYIRLLKGDLHHIGLEHIDGFIAASQSGGGLNVPGLDLRLHKDFIFPADTAIADYATILHTPGQSVIKAIGARLHATLIKRFSKPRDHYSVVFPAALITGPLTVRPALREDGYFKLHSPYRQRVFEMIRIAGVPAPLRHLLPMVLTHNREPLWSVGSPIADAFKTIDPQAGPFIKLQFTRQHSASPATTAEYDGD